MNRRNRSLLAALFSRLGVTFWVVLFSISTFAAQENPQTFTIDGTLYSGASSTTPIASDPSVLFKIQILSSGQDCVLYEETQTTSTNANGQFTINVGSRTGAAKRTAGAGADPGNTMAKVFQNSAVIPAAAGSCAGDQFDPTVLQSPVRYLKITVTPSTTGVPDTFTNALRIDSVPSALVAETVQGFGPADLLMVKDDATYDLNQNNLESIFTVANFAELTALLGGTSSKYLSRSTAAGASLPSYAGNPGTPAAGSIWYDSTNKVVKYHGGVDGIKTLTNLGTSIDGSAITTGTIGGNTIINTTGDITSANMSATTGNLNTLRIFRADNTRKISISALPGLAADYSLVLPADDGNANEVLTTDGSGNLSWAAGGTASSISASDGTMAAPSISFSSDTDTGFYRVGADQIGVTTGGTARATFGSSYLSSTTAGGPQLSFGGTTSAGSPGFTFNGNTNLGMFRPAADTLGFATSGNERVRIDSSGNMGIGTNAPAGVLDVRGSSTAASGSAVGSNHVSTLNASANGDFLVGVNINPTYTPGGFTSVRNVGLLVQSGSVGIGTWPTASYGLHVGANHPTYSAALTLLNPNTTPATGQGTGITFNIGSNVNTGSIGLQTEAASLSNTQMNFSTRRAGTVTEAMRLTSAGYMGLGTDTPGTMLDVAGSITSRPSGTGAGQTGQLIMRELAANGTNTVTLKAPDAVTSDRVFVLPDSVGTNGQALTTDGSGNLSWTTVSGGGGALSALTAATGTNTIANGANAQVWNWDSLTTQNAMTMASNSMTSGNVVALTNSNNNASSTGNVLKITQSGASNASTGLMITNAGTGLSLRINDDGTDTDTTPVVVDASGQMGIGTNNPGQLLHVYNGSGLARGLSEGSSIGSFAAKATGGAEVRMDAGLTNGGFGTYSNHDFYVMTNGAEIARFKPSGDFGIGTDTPSTKLDVRGAITSRPSGTGAGQTGQLIMRELAANGTNTVTLKAPDAVTSDRVFVLPDSVGTNGQFLKTDGSGNLSWATAAGGVTAIDDLSDAKTSYGTENMYMGPSAGNTYTSGGDYNTAVGHSSLDVVTSGTFNTGFGARSLKSLTTGVNNTAIGSWAMGSSIGSGVSNNTAVGMFALMNSSGNDNTAVGKGSGATITSGGGNSAFGSGSLAGVTTGTANTGLGLSAGANISTGNYNVVIGAWVDAPTATSMNTLTIGNLIYGTGLGTGTTASTGTVGIGTPTPATTLDVMGAVTVRPKGTAAGDAGQVVLRELVANGSHAISIKAADSIAADQTFVLPATAGSNGQQLTTDGSGNLSWAAAGGTPSLSSLSAATATNTINNVNYAQVWNWNSLTTETAMTIASNSMTTGNVLALTNSNNAVGSTGNVLKVAQSGTSNASVGMMITNAGTGASLRINDDGTDTDTTPVIVDAAGRVGIGTVSPNAPLTVVRNGSTGTQARFFGSNEGFADNMFLGSIEVGGGLNGTGGNSDYYFGRLEYVWADGLHVSSGAALSFDTTVAGQTMANATTRMYINTNGLIGMGTDTPGTKLDVVGSITSRPSGTGAGQTGQLIMRELAANGTNTITVKAADSMAADQTFVLPATAGSSGQQLTTDGSGNLSWAAAGSGGPLSGVTAATATNTIANANYAQVWNWDTLTTENAMTMASNSMTTGNVLSLTNSFNSATSTGNVLKVTQSGTSNASVGMMITNAGTGYSLRINDDGTDTDTTPVIVDASGNMGIGTTTASGVLDARGATSSDNVVFPTEVTTNNKATVRIGKALTNNTGGSLLSIKSSAGYTGDILNIQANNGSAPLLRAYANAGTGESMIYLGTTYGYGGLLIAGGNTFQPTNEDLVSSGSALIFKNSFAGSGVITSTGAGTASYMSIIPEIGSGSASGVAVSSSNIKLVDVAPVINRRTASTGNYRGLNVVPVETSVGSGTSNYVAFFGKSVSSTEYKGYGIKSLSSTSFQHEFEGNVSIGTTTPQAGLDIKTTGNSSAILVPRDTVANRPSSPVNGMIRYASDTDKFEAYANGAWIPLSGGLMGTLKMTTTASCRWSHTSNSPTFVSLATNNASCPSATVTGAASAPSEGKIPAIKFASLPPGDYEVTFSGFMPEPAGSDVCTWMIYDGTNYSGLNNYVSQMVGRFSYSSTQTNITFYIQGTRTGTSGPCVFANDYTTIAKFLEIWVKRL